MQLEFNKRNLVYVLLILNAHRSEGQFLALLLERMRKDVEAHNARQRGSDRKIPVYARIYQPVSRATMFNYLADLRSAFPGGYEEAGAYDLSESFCASHPRLANKFFKKFNPVSFAACAEFLMQGEFLRPACTASSMADVPNGLFFAMQNFLGANAAFEAQEAQALTGAFQVYRPSLTMPGKVLVSAAVIRTQSDGALAYEELMHFKLAFGWRRQRLQGYVLSKGGRILIITRDSNSGFVQHALIKPMFRAQLNCGQGRIDTLAGLYSGATNNTASGLFSTGIFLARKDFRSLERFPIQRWKTGHMKEFGLVEPGSVSRRVMRFLEPQQHARVSDG